MAAGRQGPGGGGVQVSAPAIITKQVQVQLGERAAEGDSSESHIIRAVITSTCVDAHRDIVIPSGLSTTRYEQNPIFAWQHPISELFSPGPERVLGRCERLKLVGEGDREQLIGDFRLAVDENPTAAMVYRLFKGKYLSAVSIGFIATSYAYSSADAKRQGYPAFAVHALESGAAGRVIGSGELLEVSAVFVPSNPEAVGRTGSATCTRCGNTCVNSQCHASDPIVQLLELHHSLTLEIGEALADEAIKILLG